MSSTVAASGEATSTVPQPHSDLQNGKEKNKFSWSCKEEHCKKVLISLNDFTQKQEKNMFVQDQICVGDHQSVGKNIQIIKQTKEMQFYDRTMEKNSKMFMIAYTSKFA